MSRQDGQAAARALPAWQRRPERGSTFWLAVMTRLSLRLGRRLSRGVVYGIALYFVLAVPAARRASRDYLNRVLPRPATWLDLYRHILCFASTIHDRVYLLNDRDDLFNLRQAGVDELLERQAGHGGCLLFGAHLGSFELLRSVARDKGGFKVYAAMYPDNARRINAALTAINRRATLDLIPLGQFDTMLAVHDRLQDGAMVGLLADRASGPDHYLPATFLGATAYFPSGPFRMAAMLRQPVYFMAGLYQGGNRYDIQFELLDDCSGERAASREERVRALLENYVAALERHCRSAPFNWFNFYDFWDAADRETD